MTQLQRDRLKESLDSVPGLIDAVRARLSRATTAGAGMVQRSVAPARNVPGRNEELSLGAPK
jgi:hypothetical protein